MAENWIKMRAELLDNPRFLSLCEHLKRNSGLLEYCGLSDARHEIVTRVTRDVTYAALARVWSSVNTHGRVRENGDAIMSPMCVECLDPIAGFNGFGQAMLEVGWVQVEDKSLVFPNFGEFNKPVSERRKAKTAAERAREYRERKKSVDSDRHENVTNRHENVTEFRDEKRDASRSRHARDRDRIRDKYKTPSLTLPHESSRESVTNFSNPENPEPVVISPGYDSTLPCDNPELVPAAREFCERFKELTGCPHSFGGGIEEAIRLLKREVPLERLLGAAKAYAADCKKRNVERRFISGPGKWLRGGGFEEWDYRVRENPDSMLTPDELHARRMEASTRAHEKFLAEMEERGKGIDLEDVRRQLREGTLAIRTNYHEPDGTSPHPEVQAAAPQPVG